MCRKFDWRLETGRNKRWVVFACLAALWLVCWDSPARAHKVMIFAWVEGEMVHTESKFSGGRKAKNAAVLVYDEEGNQLLEGQTDEEGKYSFKVPKRSDLKVVLKASMGHLAEWRIPAEEIMSAAPMSEAEPTGKADGAGQTEEVAPSTEVKANVGAPGASGVVLTREEIQSLIDQSLDRKLAPLINMLGEQIDHGPGFSEIMGGIGYIFGLGGVALYFAARRRKG